MCDKEILYYQDADVDYIRQFMGMMVDSYSLMTRDEVLSDLYHSILIRLQEISPSYEYPFDVDYASVAYRSDI